MKVTQEKLPASQVSLEIEVTADMSKQAYDQAFQKYARSINIPGFRKGKVPRHILMGRLGPTRLKAAALEDLIEKSLQQAVKTEKIEVIGQFELRSEFEELVAKFEPGQPLTFLAAVDVEPEVTLGEYKGLTVEAVESKYDPARIDSILAERQKKMATLVPVEGRAAQAGDVAVVDFLGRFPSEGEGTEIVEVPGGSAQNFQIELVEGQFIPGFVEGIIGMNPGDTKDILTHFPESFANDELAGRSAIFHVVLHEIKEKELPELDDDFAQEVSEHETLEALRAALESNLKAQCEEETRNNQERALVEVLVAGATVEVPETLVKQEVDQMITQTAMQLSNQGVDIKSMLTSEMITKLREETRPEAIQRLKASLVINQVAAQESLTATEEEIKVESQKLLQQLGDQPVDPGRLRSVVESDIIKRKTFDWLIENSTFEFIEPSEDTEEPEEEIEAEEALIEVTATSEEE